MPTDVFTSNGNYFRRPGVNKSTFRGFGRGGLGGTGVTETNNDGGGGGGGGEYAELFVAAILDSYDIVSTSGSVRVDETGGSTILVANHGQDANGQTAGVGGTGGTGDTTVSGSDGVDGTVGGPGGDGGNCNGTGGGTGGAGGAADTNGSPGNAPGGGGGGGGYDQGGGGGVGGSPGSEEVDADWDYGTLTATTSPSNANSGDTLTAEFTIKDIDNNVDTDADTAPLGNTVTISLTTVSGSGSLNGTTNTAYSSGTGVVTFNAFNITGAGDFKITATDDTTGITQDSAQFTISAPAVTDHNLLLLAVGV